MRHLTTLTLCAALLAPSLAAAQGAVGFPMGDVGQVLRQAEQPLTQWAPPPGPLKRLKKASVTWIKEEAVRQVANPREPLALALAVDSALDEDLRRLSRRERIGRHEIVIAIVLKIAIDAEGAIAGEARLAERSGDETAARAAADKLALATAHRKVAVGWATENSLYMAAM